MCLIRKRLFFTIFMGILLCAGAVGFADTVKVWVPRLDFGDPTLSQVADWVKADFEAAISEENDQFVLVARDPNDIEAILKEYDVSISSFRMGKYDINVGEFRIFIEASGYKTTAEIEGSSGGYKDGIWGFYPGYNWEIRVLRNPTMSR